MITKKKKDEKKNGCIIVKFSFANYMNEWIIKQQQKIPKQNESIKIKIVFKWSHSRWKYEKKNLFFWVCIRS